MRHMKRLSPLIVILAVCVLYAGYFYINRIHDRYIADEVYSKMVIMDNELTELQQEAKSLHVEKDTNTEVIQMFNTLDKNNFTSRKKYFINAIHQISYDKQVESGLLDIVNSTDDKSFKHNHAKIKAQLRWLKYNHDKKIVDFNNKIENITNEVKDLTVQVGKINSENLQDLELAKLGYISRKISKTIVELNGSFIDKIIDEVIEKDRISDKSEGN